MGIRHRESSWNGDDGEGHLRGGTEPAEGRPMEIRG